MSEKKYALVTGASRGIGRACAISLAKDGFDVIVNYKSREEEAEKTVSLCKEYGVYARSIKADLSDEADVRRMFSLTLAEFGRLDVLVNNAGISEIGLFSDFTVEQYRRIFDNNLLSQMLTSKEAIKLFSGNNDTEIKKIINISSVWGQCGGSCEVLYSASKAAIIGFTKALAKELSLSKITVNCIAPGVIDTEMNACFDKDTMESLGEQIPLGKIGSPEDIARAVSFLAGDGGNYITGQVLAVNGGFYI